MNVRDRLVHPTELEVGQRVKSPRMPQPITIEWLGQDLNKVLIAGRHDDGKPATEQSFQCGDDYEVLT